MNVQLSVSPVLSGALQCYSKDKIHLLARNKQNTLIKCYTFILGGRMCLHVLYQTPNDLHSAFITSQTKSNKKRLQELLSTLSPSLWLPLVVQFMPCLLSASKSLKLGRLTQTTRNWWFTLSQLVTVLQHRNEFYFAARYYFKCSWALLVRACVRARVFSPCGCCSFLQTIQVMRCGIKCKVIGFLEQRLIIKQYNYQSQNKYLQCLHRQNVSDRPLVKR